MLLPADRPTPVTLDRRAVDQDEVVVIVARTRGSTPREIGARMRISADRSDGSIGGGHLEYEAIRLARALPVGAAGHLRFVLGASLGQCCGGEVELAFVPASWLESLPPEGLALPLTLAITPDRQQWCLASASGEAGDLAGLNMASLPGGTVPAEGVGLVRGETPWLLLGSPAPGPRVMLCGAGHVGLALARLLGTIDCRLDWVDGRDDLFHDEACGVARWRDVDPVVAVGAAPAGTHLLVMTHDHGLDYDLIAMALRRDDLPFVGLIGSMTKRRRFEHRLRQDGFRDEKIARLRCPLGDARTRDKSPGAIAILVAAQLLSVWDQNRTNVPVAGAIHHRTGERRGQRRPV